MALEDVVLDDELLQLSLESNLDLETADVQGKNKLLFEQACNDYLALPVHTVGTFKNHLYEYEVGGSQIYQKFARQFNKSGFSDLFDYCSFKFSFLKGEIARCRRRDSSQELFELACDSYLELPIEKAGSFQNYLRTQELSGMCAYRKFIRQWRKQGFSDFFGYFSKRFHSLKGKVARCRRRDSFQELFELACDSYLKLTVQKPMSFQAYLQTVKISESQVCQKSVDRWYVQTAKASGSQVCQKFVDRWKISKVPDMFDYLSDRFPHLKNKIYECKLKDPRFKTDV